LLLFLVYICSILGFPLHLNLQQAPLQKGCAQFSQVTMFLTFLSLVSLFPPMRGYLGGEFLPLYLSGHGQKEIPPKKLLGLL
jgi:hypothetical protein